LENNFAEIEYPHFTSRLIAITVGVILATALVGIATTLYLVNK